MLELIQPDDNDFGIALWTKLLQTFHCLPYKLFICKLRAYGFSAMACELFQRCYCQRQQEYN